MHTTGHLSPWLTHEQISIDVDCGPGWHELLIRAKATVGDLPFTLVRSFGAPADFKLVGNLPAGLSLVADSVSDGEQQFLLSGSDAVATLHVNARQVWLYAAAGTAERRNEIDGFCTGRFPVKVSDPDQVKVNFVFCDQNLQSVPRAIRARSWADARGHYPASAARVLDDLVAVTPTPSGRVVILHGPPGTGKTTALLTLAREWREWCHFSFILDPDQLFSGNPSYLMQLALDCSSDRWQMLVLEDTADLLRPTGHGGMHPGLARLLNLTDGAIGQGLRLMVCITTNESLSSVHRAVRRPGRCLASVYVGALSPAEANLLLPHHCPTDQPLTLAQVLERRGATWPSSAQTTSVHLRAPTSEDRPAGRRGAQRWEWGVVVVVVGEGGT